MMGQELFEHPKRQYQRYRITACEAESAVIGDPEDFVDGQPTAQQEAAMEAILEAHPDAALTFDPDTGLWVVGSEDDINQMFADREDFVTALENGEDPGA